MIVPKFELFEFCTALQLPNTQIIYFFEIVSQIRVL